MNPLRINKYLAEAGLCSRRQADVLIKAGKVKINDRVAVLGDKVRESDGVFVDGKKIIGDRISDNKTYLAFHKPVGVICTTDKNSPNNIIDYLKYPQRIYPVGRLDVNSSGLILLTNDGALVNKILKGENKIAKEYLVEVDKTVTDSLLGNLEKGMVLDGYQTLPAKAKKISDKRFSLVILEGKNRQVRRMCEAFGYNVLKLKRIRIGKIKLDDLPVGKYRKIQWEF